MKCGLRMDQMKTTHEADREARRGEPGGATPAASILNPHSAGTNSNIATNAPR